MTKKSNPPPGERTLPANLEAERSLLGAIILHNDAYEAARQIIGPHDFFRDSHRRIFAALATLLERPSGAVDLVTLKDELSRTGDLGEVGGPVYLAALVDGVPRSTNINHYAGIVKNTSLLRGLIAATSKIQTAAYEAEEPARDILASADRLLVELQHGQTGHLVDLATSSAALMNDVDYRMSHKGELFGLTTGFKSVDDLTLGLQRADLIVLAARPSVGKTSLALNVAVAVAESGEKVVAIFSMEMRRLQLEYRLLASMSGVPMVRLLAGYTFGEDELNKVSAAIGRMHACRIYIDDTAGRTATDIRRECRRVKVECGLDLVVIDYVQLMAGTSDRRGATRNEEVTDISRRLKALAKELDVPILLVSQLNRASELRADPRPRLSDLRESGALEQDADLVCFLHRKNHREGGVTNFIVEKQRQGMTGTVNLTLDRDITLFTDGGEEPPQTPEQAEEDRRQQTRRLIAGRRAHSR